MPPEPTPTPTLAPTPAPTPETYSRSEIDALLAKLAAPPTPQPAPQPGSARPPAGDKVSAQEIAALRQLRAKLDELAEGKNPEEVLAEYQELRVQSLTAAEREKEALENAKSATERYNTLQQKYDSSIVERDVLDAATPRASTPAAAKLILKELASSARVEKDGKVSYGITVTLNGTVVQKRVSAAEAVAHLESRADDYGPLFKSFASSGSGARGNDNRFKDPTTGQLSVESIAALTMEEYMKIRADSPESLGFNRPANGLAAR